MTDLILNTDDPVQILAKSHAKIEFLQKQVSQKDQYIKQLEQMVQVQKDALQILNTKTTTAPEKEKNEEKSSNEGVSLPQPSKKQAQSDQLLLISQILKQHDAIFCSLKFSIEERDKAQAEVISKNSFTTFLLSFRL